jgi:hypothetical protein
MCDVAMFLRYENVLLETQASRFISSLDISALLFVKEAASKIFGVSLSNMSLT